MKISIIIAASMKERGNEKHDRTVLLKHCLKQIRNGGHDDFEVLVAADGHSEKIMNTITALNDDRFKYNALYARNVYSGGHQRNAMTAIATGKLLCYIDDDDYYVDGALKLIHDSAEKHPGTPLIFCMQYRDGRTLWTDDKAKRSATQGPKVLRCHVGTPMFVIPNAPKRLGRWGLKQASDADFFETSLTPENAWPEPVWFRDVVARVRHPGDRKPW